MMHSEFNKLIHPRLVSGEEYNVVETVYGYHPIFEGNDSSAKQMIAELFKAGGMGLMREMLPAAQHVEQIEQELAETMTKADRLRQQRRDFVAQYKNGGQ